MKKSHGPAFRKELKPLMECATCRGNGAVSGIFHQLDCTACRGSGWVCQSTGEALPLEDLVPQLNMKLRNMAAELNRARHSQGGAHEQYEQNNRRGVGGSNYTGD
ncbi:hypothetical protein ALP83_02319 [Pseudomonas syringae pv. actinidiae]|uniref:Prophage PssSM-03 n=1 Tax=Pseudomonas syringae pv. actinidiae TaxID=103796 RepID=A0A7Z6XZJ6_PSESF|nr:hypothetical protein [Pseudomonas syringae]RMR53236.1 hypothetical protein ALP83_02319 [Pseudomonas syringae pv. actinidiae]